MYCRFKYYGLEKRRRCYGERLLFDWYREPMTVEKAVQVAFDDNTQGANKANWYGYVSRIEIHNDKGRSSYKAIVFRV